MRKTMSFLALTSLGLAALQAPAQTPATTAGDPPTAARAESLVDRHNHWRGEVDVPPLAWSAELAAFAQAWADRLAAEGCTMEHRPKTGDWAQRYGENLYHASPVIWSDGRTEVQDITPEQVVDKWGSERADYDYEADACADGKMCGHYTQLVWSQSSTVGCGMTVCPDRAQVWVCNYDPAGNVLGERPY